ncbi:MAG: hypothetical protein WA395_07660 [Nitrososphaeraceae archaeon]
MSSLPINLQQFGAKNVARIIQKNVARIFVATFESLNDVLQELQSRQKD